MNDFMGVNIHAQLYFNHYLGANTNYDISIPFRWVRNYHPWDWFEAQNDNYQWNFSGEGKWKWFDNYYKLLNEDSVNLLICVMSPPSWITGGKISFHDNGDGSTENNYRECAEYLAQLATRYGPTGAHPDSQIETSDKSQGLDYCRYFEDSNEPNQWWETSGWNPNNFGVFLNATHDGLGVSTDVSLPIAGVKKGDANAFHVLGGMAGTALTKSDKFNGSYLDTAVKATGRNANQVMDVINFHLYWNTTDTIPWPWTNAIGVSPENGIYERSDSSIFKMKAWRDKNAPGTPIWLTEFGWDTYTGGGSNHSYQYAPELQQANYIMRSFALLKREGIDKAFVYFDQDPNSASTVQYASSGLVKDEANGFARKRSFFYMSTMRNILGNYTFTKADRHAEGSPQIYQYRYTRTSNDIVLMVWCRSAKTLVDNGAIVSNYQIDFPEMISCTQVKPENNDLDGVSSELVVANPGTSLSNVTVPLVSETPLFLKVTTNLQTNVSKQHLIKHSSVYRITGHKVSFSNFPDHSVITISLLNGAIVWKRNTGTSRNASFTAQNGLYTYSIKGKYISDAGIFMIKGQ